MKRLFSMFLSLSLITTLCSGCSLPVKQENDQLVIYASGAIMGSIQSYALEYYQTLYPEVEVSFYPVKEEDSPENRKAELSTALMGNDGPDIIVDFAENQSIEKLAESNCFYDIGTDILGSEENYVTQIVERGNLDGKQIMIPLAYTVGYFASTDEILEEAGFSTESLQNPEEFYQEGIKYLDSNPGQALFCDSPENRTRVLRMVFPDTMESTEILESDLFEKYITLLQKNAERCVSLGITQENMTTPLTQLQSGKCIFAVCENGMDWESVGTLGPVGSPKIIYLKAAGTDGVCANINICAEINKKSKNIENAKNFLTILLTYYQDRTAFDDSIPKDSLSAMTYAQMTGRTILATGDQLLVDLIQSGKVSQMRGGTLDVAFWEKVEPIPEETVSTYLNVASKVGAVGINFYGGVYDYFTPYIEGQDSFESCLNQAMDYLSIYMYE